MFTGSLFCAHKSPHLFPCPFLQLGHHFPTNTVPVLLFLHWWQYLTPSGGTSTNL
jgi:hypothetical protein